MANNSDENTSLNVSLPTSLREFIDGIVAKGGYTSSSEYVRELIRHERTRLSEDWLATELLKGLASGNPVDATPEFWKEEKRLMRERLAKRNEAA